MIPTSLKNAGYIVAAYIGVSHNVLIAFALLMVIDVITGMIASKRIEGCNSITSDRLKFGVGSKLLLLAIPFSLALCATAIGQDLRVLTSSSISIMALAELYSIISNIVSYRTGERVPEFDAVSIVLGKVRAFLRAFIQVQK